MINLTEISLEWEMFQTKVVEKIKTHILYSKTTRQNTAGPDSPQMAMLYGAEKMRFACWIPKYTDTGSLYLIRIADSSKQYSVARHHVQRKPTVQFPWKHWTLYTVDSYIYANNKDGRYCCVSMTTMVTRTRHNVTLHLHCLVLFVTLTDDHNRHSKCFQMCYATVRILRHWNFSLYNLSAYLHLISEATRDEQRQ
jgi:hypothetical protein